MRGWDIDREEDERDDAVSIGRSGGSGAKAKEKGQYVPKDEPQPTLSPRRELIQFRDREYRLRVSEREILREIARFPAVPVRDLQQELSPGNASALIQDLASLRKQGLLKRFSIPTALDGERLSLVVLSREGKALVERWAGGKPGPRERIYAGFIRQDEALHDAALYRMYRHEARRIHAGGGTVTRVVLESELKGQVWKDIAALRKKEPSWSEAALRGEVASAYQLPVLEGRIVFPDLRVEYEDARGENLRVDLELATEHYRSAHIAGKLQAGFRVYAPKALVSGRLRGEYLDQHGMERILSL